MMQAWADYLDALKAGAVESCPVPLRTENELLHVALLLPKNRLEDVKKAQSDE